MEIIDMGYQQFLNENIDIINQISVDFITLKKQGYKITLGKNIITGNESRPWIKISKNANDPIKRIDAKTYYLKGNAKYEYLMQLVQYLNDN